MSGSARYTREGIRVFSRDYEDGVRILAAQRTLVLGTHNRKKAEELVDLLAPLGLELKTLADFSKAIVVVEDGNTFAENAQRKACVQARHLGLWVLGEDSGICVDSLKGKPGIYSARFAHPNASDEENNRHLLAELGNTPPEKRGAQYVCHMTLCDSSGSVRAESEGTCRGRIRFEPAGRGGFGYDPLFEILEYHQTFGQLGPAVKRALSHRGQAMRRLVPSVERLVNSGQWQSTP